MQDAAVDRGAIEPEDRNHVYHSIVSDLVSLIEHVQASLTLIEQVAAGEASRGDQDVAANIIVLDDVTPRYATASAALKVCNADLGIALLSLLDSDGPQRGPNAFADRDLRSVRQAALKRG
jgi:hypothetical protein